MSGLLTSPPSPVPIGLKETIEAAGHSVVTEPDGWLCDDVAAVQTIISGYVGSASELAWWKADWQAQLDALLDNHFDLKAFIRAGSSTTVTASGVGNFLATIVDNYRTLRANIAAATTVAQVQAINLNSGWPSNP